MGEYPGLENESVAAHHKPLGRKMYEEGRRVGEKLGVRVVLLPDDQFQEDRRERNLLEESSRHRKQCYDLWNRALIAANGDVLPCCASPFGMGNLRDSSFAEIWRGPAFNTLRRQFLSAAPPPMCRQCTGTAWAAKSLRRDLRFYFAELLVPRVKRRAKRRLKKYPAIRWLKRRWDGLRAKS